MAEQLEPTEALIALLRDVDQRQVRTNPHDFSAELNVPGEDKPADVSAAVWAMEKASWVREPADSRTWVLTDRGREVLDRGTP